jgi:hypothetical protein
MSFELPPPVRLSIAIIIICPPEGLNGGPLLLRFSPFPKNEILDYLP